MPDVAGVPEDVSGEEAVDVDASLAGDTHGHVHGDDVQSDDVHDGDMQSDDVHSDDAPAADAPIGDVSDLIAAVPLARAALAEITPESTIGEPLGHVVEAAGAVSLLFASNLAGYPGWHWTVTVGRADDDAQPTVLEAELMPGDDALLAPDWVPWSERLAEYQAAQEALAAEAEEAGAEGDADEDGAADAAKRAAVEPHKRAMLLIARRITATRGRDADLAYRDPEVLLRDLRIV